MYSTTIHRSDELRGIHGDDNVVVYGTQDGLFDCPPEFNFARICARHHSSGEGSKDARANFRQ
jgi:hypothetical protein